MDGQAPGDVLIEETPPDHPDATWCFDQYAAELDRRFPGGFGYDRALPLDVSGLAPPDGLVLIARMAGRPVGCACLKGLGHDVADIKRVWVAPEARGAGIGRRLMDEVEARALAAGCDRVRLETNRTLVEAIAMYRGRGYREVPPFNEERYADHWFEKTLERRSTGAML